MKHLHLAAVALLVTWFPAAAHAQVAPSESDRAEAVRRFALGVRAYDEKRYDAALAAFRRAYDLSPTYKLQYNIGQVCLRLDDAPCIVRAFDAFLEGGGDEIPPSKRETVRAERDRASPRVARLDVSANADGARISVDGVVVGTTPARGIYVSAGRLRVDVVGQGFLPETRVVDAVGEQVTELRFELVDPSSAPAAPTVGPLPSNAAARAPEGRVVFTTAAWIGLGAAAALLAGGATTGGLALAAKGDFRATRFDGADAEEQARRARQSALNLGLASDLLFAASGAAVGATLVGTFLLRARSSAPRVAVEPSSRRLLLTASFPW